MTVVLLVALSLALAACGTDESTATTLDCDETRTVDVRPPDRFAGDPAAVAAWYLEDRGLTGTDLVEDAPTATNESPAALVRRDGRVVAKTTIESNGSATVESCADLAR